MSINTSPVCVDHTIINYNTTQHIHLRRTISQTDKDLNTRSRMITRPNKKKPGVLRRSNLVFFFLVKAGNVARSPDGRAFGSRAAHWLNATAAITASRTFAQWRRVPHAPPTSCRPVEWISRQSCCGCRTCRKCSKQLRKRMSQAIEDVNGVSGDLFKLDKILI